MNIKIILMLVMILFLVGTVSAAEWDNVKSYDEETRTITIKNALGLPLIGSNIAEVKLLSDLEVVVPPGYHQVAEFEINSFTDYDSFISGIELFDINNKLAELDNPIDVMYWGDIVVEDFSTTCVDDPNNKGDAYDKSICTNKKIGEHTEKGWLPFDKKALLNKKIKVGLFTNVKHGDSVEWIPEFAGVKVREWAVWTGDSLAGLVSCWTLDETSGTLAQDFGRGALNNGTSSGITVGVPSGIPSLGNAYFFDGGGGNLVDVGSSASLNLTGNLTIGVVMNTTPDDGGDFGGKVNTAGYPLAIAGQKAFFKPVPISGGSGDAVSGTSDVDTGVAVFMVASHWEANSSVYVNGTLETTAGTSAGALKNSPLWQIGQASVLGNFVGYVSEVWVLNYTVNAADVAAMWNGGAVISCRPDVAPSIVLNAPADEITTFTALNTYNATGSDPTTVQNMSLIVNGSYIETNSSPVNGANTLFNHTFADFGLFNWTVEVCDDVDQCVNATARNITYNFFNETSQTFNASSLETAQETFVINITTNGTTITDSYLWYDDIPFLATITNTAGDDYNLSRTIDIPLTAETKEWLFNFSAGGTSANSSTQEQVIGASTFVHCGAAPTYLNFTFKNETIAEEAVTAGIDTDWNFWLGTGTIFKELSFTNVTENANYSFCFTSNVNKSLTANVSMTYTNAISEQRSFAKEYDLTNETTNQTLFLLPTADGVFVSFQTVTIAEQIVRGVAANVTRAGDLISSGVTDDAGLIQYFLDPDTTYVFSFFKTGFDVVVNTLKPTQSTFTVTMGGVIPPIANDTTKGISYTILPIANFLGNNTNTEFNLTFASEFWELDFYGFALKNSTGDVFNVTSDTTSTGGTLGIVLDSSFNTTTDIIMEVFWTIETNQTNVTRLWTILDTTDEGFSIKTFFDDLGTYLTSGLFGLTSFGLGIIIFIIIILITGTISFKTGLTDAAGLSTIVFALVLFFDVGLGIMPNPIGAVPNFPSIFVGLIFAGTLIKRAITR